MHGITTSKSPSPGLRADKDNAETELIATEFEEPLTASSVRYATKIELSLDR
jgi:hypothetical protein